MVSSDTTRDAIVALLRQAASNKEIAVALGVHKRTVENYIQVLRYSFCVGNMPRSELVLRLHERSPHQPGKPSPEFVAGLNSLGAREKAIALYRAGGLLPSEIARQLGISRQTVYDYLINVYVVMDVVDAAGLVALYCGSPRYVAPIRRDASVPPPVPVGPVSAVGAAR